MATRDYNFIVGPETSTLPTASTPSASSDIVNLGYADLAYQNQPALISNLGIKTSVGSNALLIELTQYNRQNPSTGSSAVKVAFRDTNILYGAYSVRSVTSALTLTISAGSTLGMASGKTGYIWVYLVDSDGAGTLKLAVSNKFFEDNTFQSTTAEGGAGGADSATALYSNAAYSSKPIRLIGRMTCSNTTGNWTAVPSDVILAPGMLKTSRHSFVATTSGNKNLAPNASSVIVPFDSAVSDSFGNFDTANNVYYIGEAGTWHFDSGIYINSTNVLANRYDLRIFKNGSLYKILWSRTVAATTVFYLSGGTTIPDLIVGDRIGMYVFGSGDNSASNISTDSGLNTVHFSGHKV